MCGKFIVIEGLDGSGKSTQAKMLNESIENSILTCDPWISEPGKLFQSAISNEITFTKQALALLLLADRSEHIHNLILPNLKEGRTVISDRFYLSFLAYHTAWLSVPELYDLSIKSGAIIPDLTIFLDISPNEAMKRIEHRKKKKTFYEELQKLEKISNDYYYSIKFLESRENIVMLSAIGDKHIIAKKILQEAINVLSHKINIK